MVTAIAEFDTAAIPVVDASRSPGLSFERRYEIVSEQFADWLVMEPIQFPPQHPTYGWACRVSECEGAVAPTHTTYLCDKHAKQYSLSNPTADVEDFISSAEPIDRSRIGFALRAVPRVHSGTLQSRGERTRPVHCARKLACEGNKAWRKRDSLAPGRRQPVIGVTEVLVDRLRARWRSSHARWWTHLPIPPQSVATLVTHRGGLSRSGRVERLPNLVITTRLAR